MRKTKRPRPNSGPPEWNPYLIQQMTEEEATPLLWIPQVLGTLPANPTQPYLYGIPVVVDGDTRYRLDTTYTWISLTWLVKWDREKGKQAVLPTAECKVHLSGTDDSNYGAWMTECDATELMSRWGKLLQYLEEFGAKQFGVNGEELLDYCDTIGAYERDYN